MCIDRAYRVFETRPQTLQGKPEVWMCLASMCCWITLLYGLIFWQALQVYPPLPPDSMRESIISSSSENWNQLLKDWRSNKMVSLNDARKVLFSKYRLFYTHSSVHSLNKASSSICTLQWSLVCRKKFTSIFDINLQKYFRKCTALVPQSFALATRGLKIF